MPASKKSRVLVTGGAGFIGHHFVEALLKSTCWDIVIIDKLQHTGIGWDRLRDINVYDDKRVLCLAHCLTQPITNGMAHEIGEIDWIFHLAAESHVDNSIIEPGFTIQNNVMQTVNILDFTRHYHPTTSFLYFSTDEIYGPADKQTAFNEIARWRPSNPYSASKAASEAICYSYANTYKLQIVVTNTMNVFGERQHPEKFIPKTIRCIRDNVLLPIHAAPNCTEPGSRFYIHARNVADAIIYIATKLAPVTPNRLAIGCGRESYGRFNIVGELEIDNLTLANAIANIMGKPLKYQLVDYHSSRPGHDLRYALDGRKLTSLGWKPPREFHDSLAKMIHWTLAHPKWLDFTKPVPE